MFESLSERLQSVISSTQSKTLNEDNVSEALREVRRAFLEADVSLKVVKAFISNIKDKAYGEGVLQSVSASNQFVKIVNDELVNLMGGENKPLSLDGEPNIIMLLGLQGSGKTTSSAKLSVRLRKQGRNPLLIAADVYRPAAITQLQTLGKQINVPVFTIENCTDVQEIVSKGVDYAKENGHNTVIIDTAGRLQVDTEMMAELVIVDRLFKPAEKLLVIDAMTGQEAVNVAQTFNEQLEITGVVLTKLDGDARGGAALSIVHSTGKPIKLTGQGEKLDALEPFYPERMAQRILGMGDIVSLVEKAQENFDEENAKKLEQQMRKGEFSLEDFMNMQKQMKMLGSFGNILGMLPIQGLSKKEKEQISQTGETQMKRIESCINSMTVSERQNPDVINRSRKSRISKGSGIPEEEITEFLKSFRQMRQMMKQMSGLTQQMKGSGGKMKMPKGFSKGKFPKF